MVLDNQSMATVHSREGGMLSGEGYKRQGG